ncbi:shikimate O-hydroxycinnamoyltransferase [Cinnamomum micranthum f. kanehirae]|uniref:Shikimate O-hydroxycinnamoyltransferase n=1 Tax=Cinnamomum micranthum f. kanehirae TaxID=337451 RepID=A0A3S3NBH2_9MAGN|nr:shikimate O-hydroxycinnamoyltransferase [Cinnamomum micranthum f. kanehirae]
MIELSSLSQHRLFLVTINWKDIVAAASPLHEHLLPLSNFNLLFPPIDVNVFFCYKKPHKPNDIAFTSMTRILKNSLSQTLVSFYALAGEVVMSSAGKPELLCNNRGVDFMEAYADMELQELQLYNPDASVGGKLLPKKKDGVLCIQRMMHT